MRTTAESRAELAFRWPQASGPWVSRSVVRSTLGWSSTPMPRLLFLPNLLLLALAAMAQEPGPAKYRMELLSMIRSDSTRGYNDVQAAILVTPIKAKDWPPVLSMRIGHRINDRDSITFIDMQAPGPQKARLTIYDRSVSEKNTKLYARIQPKLDLVKDEELLSWHAL